MFSLLIPYLLLSISTITCQTHYTIYSGLSSDNIGDLLGYPRWNIMKYYPSYLDVIPGDTISFRITSDEPHTITYYNNQTKYIFTNPELLQPMNINNITTMPVIFSSNSSFSTGLLYWNSLPDFTIRISNNTKPGLYIIYCAIHPGMIFSLNIQNTSKTTNNTTTANDVINNALQQQSIDLHTLEDTINNRSLVTANLDEYDYA